MVRGSRCVAGAGVRPAAAGDLHVLVWIALGDIDRRQREAVELVVSSQMRIAYASRTRLTLPTPLIRLSGS